MRINETLIFLNIESVNSYISVHTISLAIGDLEVTLSIQQSFINVAFFLREHSVIRTLPLIHNQLANPLTSRNGGSTVIFILYLSFSIIRSCLAKRVRMFDLILEWIYTCEIQEFPCERAAAGEGR